jgi:molybdate transport system regulatory protein
MSVRRLALGFSSTSGEDKVARQNSRHAMRNPQANALLRPRIRVLQQGIIVLGPGKAELLLHLAETHSLSESARRMKMSYMKAWLSVQTMNRSYRKPLVQAARGGRNGGGARLTLYGERVLACYQEMERLSIKAIQGPWRRLRRMLSDSSP